jgi:hypothetical protein
MNGGEMLTKHPVFLGAAVLALLSTGCLSHVPRVPAVNSDRYEAIQWRTSLESARAEAASTQTPLMVIAVAGARDGHC